MLDVGCGTGRLLLDYLSQGLDIDGVDISPEMLYICQQKAEGMGFKATTYECNMEAMRLPRRYKTILVPSSSFQLVLDPEDVHKAILNLFTHLLPTGTLVMPFMLLRKKGEPLEHDWQHSGEVLRPADGAIMRRWSKSRFDPATQLEHNADRYEVIKDGVMIASEHHVRSPATQEYTQQQALNLFILAGLVDIRIYKGFTRAQASPDEEMFTISGVRP